MYIQQFYYLYLMEEYPNIQAVNPMTCISSKIRKCNRIVANVFRQYLNPMGITDSQLSVLFITTKGQMINQARLSQMLYLDKSTVNRNIERLVQNGYIAFNDQKYLFTTSKGKDFLEKIIPQWDKAMEEIREILDDEGELALNVLFKKLTA